MMTLGDVKTFMSSVTVNQGLAAAGSIMGNIAHWVVNDIYTTAEFWWNQDEDTFDTVDGQSDYFLNNKVMGNKVWGMYDQDNDRKIHKLDSLQEIYDRDPTPTDEADPRYWAYVRKASCQAVPAAAGTISISSTNASDSGDFVIRGKVSGIERYEILGVQGTTAVNGSLSWDANEPLMMNLEQAGNGLLTATVGAITVAQIPPGHLRVLRPQIRLDKVPGTTGDTIRYFFYKRSVPLISDSELVDLPDMAFRAFRYGCEEICFLLVNKIQASQAAFEKREKAISDLIIASERDVAGKELKMAREPSPFAFRLPDLIQYTVA